jgi:glycosyltransferase involved in cell wall biosynthesis
LTGRLSICIAHNSSPGGALRFVEESARRLARSHDIVVVTWGSVPDPPVDGVGQRWLRAPRLALPPPLHPFGDVARSAVASVRAARTIDRWGCDAVLMFACQWGQAPAGLRAIRTPTVYVAHEARRRTTEPGYRPSGVERTGWRRGLWIVGSAAYDGVGGALDRWAMAAPVRFATSAHGTADNLRAAYGIDPAVVEPGVDVERFRPPAESAPRAGVLCVGALDPTKRPDLVVRALGMLPVERRPSLRLVYNRRSASYAAQLDELAAELRVDLVHRRAISDEELVAEYQRAAVVVAAARAEPFGLTVPEAGACGAPVVAVDEGGYRETVSPGRTGLLVAPSPRGLADGIDAVLRGAAFDATTIAAEARARWSWDRCADQLAELCRSVSAPRS